MGGWKKRILRLKIRDRLFAVCGLEGGNPVQGFALQ
jgi:hypothetical protein